MNSNYIKGRRKEYRLMHILKSNGNDIVLRSAGSHSPIDVVAIDKKAKMIKLIQCKPDNFSEAEKEKLIKEWGIDDDERGWSVCFRVL